MGTLLSQSLDCASQNSRVSSVAFTASSFGTQSRILRICNHVKRTLQLHFAM